jgi:hypothetical protein
VVGGELEGHMRAPGVSHDKWPREAKRANRPRQGGSAPLMPEYTQAD